MQRHGNAVPVSIRVSGCFLHTNRQLCFFFPGRSLEIELSLFVTPRDNPCHATVPMAMSWLRVQHRKLQFGEERVQLHRW